MRFRTVPLFLLTAGASALAVDKPHFSRDILPILSENCLACHGQDEKHRKADLRLDTREGATALNDGFAAIVPGKPGESELLKRILSEEPDEVMPPPKSHKPPLSKEQIAMLTEWIQAGAPWGKHWAFERPEKLPLPRIEQGTAATKGSSKPEIPNPVDAFVRARLEKEKLAPSPPAAPHTLIRRMSFDLTGLPPTPAEVAAFTEDFSRDARLAAATLADRLLASPHFGERMAMWWLDAARYADTDGFQSDATRTNWPWRDWVVSAFNANMRFDQFTIEQFAGDLLPDARPEQKLATCFHRNHMTNGEGGRDPEESRVDYVIDRVNAFGTTWLGLTLGCCQCHSHKFDPVSQADYYSLTAFFNSIDEDGKAGAGAKPYLAYQSPLAERAVTEAQQLVEQRKPAEARARSEAEKPFAAWLSQRLEEVRGGFSAWRVLRPVSLESIEGTSLVQEDDGIVRADGANPRQDDYRVITTTDLPRVTGLRLEVLPHASHTGGKFSRGQTGEFILTDIKVQVRRRGSSQIRDITVDSAVADFSPPQKEARNYGNIKGVLDDDPRNGWTTKGAPAITPHTAVFALAGPLVLDADEEIVFELRHRSTDGDANIGRFRLSATDQPGETIRTTGTSPMEDLAASGAKEPARIEPKLRERLFGQFLEDHAPYREAREALARAERQLAETKKAAEKLNVMVLAERAEPRDTFVLVRGVWDKHGEKVPRDVPPAIAAWPSGADRTRLGLARWICSPENPLTARVVVNHLWQLCFGTGLVRTPEDFGLQGERPTHPELLDWLAVEFIQSGWDVKHMLKLIVSSKTYRQSSAVVPALLARDPENRLLARAPRFRLPSWMLRDSVLAASGLLNRATGGPPVRPYQPAGVWEEMFMGRFTYAPSEGAAQYRRTLYAFWRRAIAPTFLFDSAQRRVCEVRNSRTNTPLQALTLLNDTTWLEAARSLAARSLRDAPDPGGRLRNLFLAVLGRPPSEKEAAILHREHKRALTHYREVPADAVKFLDFGQHAPDAATNTAELAAHTLVASLVLNLDEAISHE